MTELLERVKEELGNAVLEVSLQGDKEVFVRVPEARLTEVVETLFKRMGARFVTVTGLDTRDWIELLYHFCFDKDSRVVTIKTQAAKPEVQVDSITPIIRGAEWTEREIHDLLGVNFRNHPNLKRLILSDDWPEGVYPLRKDFRK